MENMMTAMAGAAMLVFLVFAGVAAVLVVASSLIGLFGGATYLLRALAARARRAGSPHPKPVHAI